jgi:hypothetical protein
MRLLPLFLLACDPTGSGTSIGNPSKTLLRLAPAGDGITLDVAETTIDALLVDGVEIDTPTGEDLLRGVDLQLPSAALTSVEVRFDGLFTVLGVEEGATLDLGLDVRDVRVDSNRGPLVADEPHVFELGEPGWLDADRVGWTRGVDHVVRPGDAVHDPLVRTLRERASWLPDDDGDGNPDR